ncbi:hypothetical protein [Flavobacterium piscinae]|uniref:hypothetical protein n=1 Tax=Flavobacterium piscinae TaxID=2506424 RepID=UPI002AAA72A0|nr:hypothetical protein [Flavobacterium piscinae]
MTAFLLSSANIMMPLMAFGIQNTLVKFYSEHESEEEKSRFLNLVLVLPFVIIIPIFLILFLFYGEATTLLSQKNSIIQDYVWMIPVIGLFMGYFEIFLCLGKSTFEICFWKFCERSIATRIHQYFSFCCLF